MDILKENYLIIKVLQIKVTRISEYTEGYKKMSNRQLSPSDIFFIKVSLSILKLWTFRFYPSSLRTSVNY